MKKKGNGVRKWGILTAISAILLVAVIVGSSIAFRYTTTINVALDTSTFKIIKGDSDEDTEYFKSDFESEEERVAYEEELCATIEAEGAALLKNENQALPLSSGAKVSLFGFGSANLMYGGTGSGAVDTKSAPTLKDALNDNGVEINSALWDFYSSKETAEKWGRKTPEAISDTLEANTQYAVNEAPWEEVKKAGESSFQEYGDAAIVVISRSGGEGADLPSGENGTDADYISGSEMEITWNFPRKNLICWQE